MRFFQQIQFQFTQQQGLIRPTVFHESGNSLEQQQNNLPSSGMIGRLFTKQRTFKMLALSSIMVVLLHGFGLIWLWLPDEQAAPARPVVMEVTIIPVSAPKPKVAPPPPPTPAKIKPAPKKTQPRPRLKKMPVVPEPADFAAKQQVFDVQPVEQPLTSVATDSVAPPTKIEPFIEANVSADYAENPKPDYPALAKSMGWQGKVMLKVQVSEEGLSAAVEIEHSSGHEILDESAVEALKQWRFTPAKRGETPIASSVIVPIIFTLQDQS